MTYWYYSGEAEDIYTNDKLGTFYGFVDSTTRFFPYVEVIKDYMSDNQFVHFTMIAEISEKDFNFMQSMTKGFTQ